ncbi:hypothetical protein [Tengunoibacter tsumagoiensis]|uniref:Uncharacterized protein n=1 Tax=Tengunoibacter tsumagoiensis TaxID=2014871 RepID=A0A402A3P1_9CHLR|nr:hypothetical protein [Tengunoibacter tsumagoiensis]GCE13655.1 hypothetical protein KTT_35140 [Tengunoibacter tsumagoiensis]
MAHIDVHSVAVTTSHSIQSASSARGERRLRRISAWLLLFFLIQGELGAVWDREWHAFVGRDQFWTPPHTMIYSCVAGAGLIALAIVLWETLRYFRQTPGVDDDSTIRILRVFHAPLGFSVLGFGALLALAAAPLDNYWHELYGIDVALWAPFHMMGVTGGMIGILGMVYIFASEASIERQSKAAPRRILGFSWLEVGTILALASFMNFVFTGFLQFPLITIGTLHISTYPLPLVAGGMLCLIGATRFTRKTGSALLFLFFLFLHTWIVEVFVPWAIRVAVEQQDLPYRVAGSMPYFRWDYALLPIVFLLPALAADLLIWRAGKTSQSTMERRYPTLYGAAVGALLSIPAFLLAPIVLQSYSEFAPVFLPEPGLAVSPILFIAAVCLSSLVGLLAGALGGFLGADLGDIWRWNTR